MKNFGSGMVRFGSIRVSGPLVGEHISSIWSDIGPDRSVQILNLESVLSDLGTRPLLSDNIFESTETK